MGWAPADAGATEITNLPAAAGLTALEDLLLDLFSADELRRFLSKYYGERLVNRLPGPTSSPAAQASEAARALQRDGEITDKLFDALLVERPGRQARIRAVAPALVAWARGPASSDAPAAQGSGGQVVHNHGPIGQQLNVVGGANTFNIGGTGAAPAPAQAGNAAKVKILFLAANPLGTDRLALDREFRGIRERLSRSALRDRFELVSAWAVRTGDLREELLVHQPCIVHFAGHGAAEGLILEGTDGRPQSMPLAALSRLFGLFASHVKVVVLNACYSEAQAAAIAQKIPVVVGMSGATLDEAGVLFADGFYQALGYGRTVFDAVELGCSAVELDGVRLGAGPQIKTTAGVDAKTYVVCPA